jgi:hypothetical protein
VTRAIFDIKRHFQSQLVAYKLANTSPDYDLIANEAFSGQGCKPQHHFFAQHANAISNDVGNSIALGNGECEPQKFRRQRSYTKFKKRLIVCMCLPMVVSQQWVASKHFIIIYDDSPGIVWTAWVSMQGINDKRLQSVTATNHVI